MGGPGNKKRSLESRTPRPKKKIKKQRRYNSDSESEDAPDFKPVNLLDSDDDDILNAEADDVGGLDEESGGSEDEAPAPKKTMKLKVAETAPAAEASEEGSSEENGDDSDMFSDDSDEEGSTIRKPKSKRNDPNAFATSLSKILSTKLTASKRADPVLSRSAAAAEASKAITDNSLEAKARKQMRAQKREALERGRVKDVLIASNIEIMGESEATTAEILQTERRLRKVAQRGVVKLFNAVRAAQVAAVDADKLTKKTGILGIGNRKEKVNELSKKGFLDLIASGGGGLKKGALEEA